MTKRTPLPAHLNKAAVARFEERFAKAFGQGSLVSGDGFAPYEVISTGVLAIDIAMGVGGYVEGRLTEIYGQDGIGKTTLTAQGVREAQRKHPDKFVGWVDMEHTLDPPWFAQHGVDLTMLRVYHPQSAEDVADAVKEMICSGLFSMVVVDSIGAMIPEVEKEKDANEATIALQAKIVTRMVKIAAVEAALTSTAVVLLNQVRANVTGFGKATTTGGGWALRHATTHKLELRRTENAFKIKVDGKEQEVGHEIAVRVERNKVAPPHKRAQFVLFHTPTDKYGPAGVDRADEAFTVGVKTGVIDQGGGGYYTFPGTGERVRGREAAIEVLRNDPSLVDTLRTLALASIADQIIVGPETDPAKEIDPEPGGAPAFRSPADLGDDGGSLIGHAMLEDKG